VQIYHKKYDIDDEIVFPAEKIAFTDFNPHEDKTTLPYWITKTPDASGDIEEIYPIEFNPEFEKDIKEILHFLLNKSSIGRIYVYPALFSITEITEGPIHVNKFMELLVDHKLYFDVTYSVMKKPRNTHVGWFYI